MKSGTLMQHVESTTEEIMWVKKKNSSKEEEFKGKGVAKGDVYFDVLFIFTNSIMICLRSLVWIIYRKLKYEFRICMITHPFYSKTPFSICS